MNIINDVISACISSAKAEKMRLKEGKKWHTDHSQLHVMVNMPFGCNKSSIIESVDRKQKYIYESTDNTYPGIIGSISKTGRLKEGAVIRAAGKCLWIDEHHSLDESSRRGLLKMLEQQRYARDLGYDVLSPVKKTRKLYAIRAIGGHFELRSRFSCLCTGIFSSNERVDDRAWLSRFMPVVVDVDVDDAYDMSMGAVPFEVKIDEYKEVPVFEDYEKFWKIHKETFKILSKNNQKIGAFLRKNPGFLRRDLLHFSRLFLWDSRGRGSVDDWEKYTPYIPFFLFNYLKSSLTLSEFKIYNLSKTMEKQRKIAKLLGCSEAYVSKVLKKIRGIGLG